ncbi:MAG TPA: Hsp20/alpha crystallin family protein [Ignavibacteriaceae bacterium]|nr:Hsp20/alpha crystallin family protein [Ignavibacteriaceae bacterium]
MTDVKDNKDTLVQEYNKEEYYIYPLVNIHETNDEFVLVADMPGVPKENVTINFADDFLTIKGKMNPVNSEVKKYILKETGYGNTYLRKFRINDTIDTNKIDAVYENGQLTVKMPKHDRVKPRTISIK